MTRKTTRGALALPFMLITGPALADDTPGQDVITAFGYRPDAHGPAGVMGDHVHRRGEWMIGLEWMHMRHSGLNQTGTDKVSDAQLLNAGYRVRAMRMTMDMAMLHIMYAPNDTLTFSLMPSWNRMGMTMLGIDPAAGTGGGHGGHGHGGLAFGQTMHHAVSGIGDTRAGVLLSLSRNRSLAVHAGLELSIPTGDSGRKNPNGTFVHYGMQPGSGTWDIEPSLTLRGIEEGFGWGVQVKQLIRLENENGSGFAFGDRFSANGWLSKPVSRSLSFSARFGLVSEGRIEGHYNGPHNHSSPPDIQANYGGRTVDAGLGANLVVGRGLRLNAEASLPLHQDLNGYQLGRDWGLNVSLSRMF